jgi:hypothetical protein
VRENIIVVSGENERLVLVGHNRPSHQRGKVLGHFRELDLPHPAAAALVLSYVLTGMIPAPGDVHVRLFEFVKILLQSPLGFVLRCQVPCPYRILRIVEANYVVNNVVSDRKDSRQYGDLLCQLVFVIDQRAS